jgi:uncharacterized damage-inducible protein DinB
MEVVMSVLKSFVTELEHEGETTRTVLQRIPEDQLSWKPHEKSMSLGQLAMHVAEMPGQIAEMAREDSFAIDSESYNEVADPESRDQLLTRLTQSLETARNTLEAMDDTSAAAEWTFTIAGKPIVSMPRIALVRTIMLNHWYHHRGQLSVYLRMLDVPVPSIYGPSADENPFA